MKIVSETDPDVEPTNQMVSMFLMFRVRFECNLVPPGSAGVHTAVYILLPDHWYA